MATASWLFPLYLFGMTLFIAPIALVGLKMMPAGANPDLYVLTLPLAEGQNALALFAFLGGFSSATSMVIVAAIAVSTMVSNHIVMPIALNFVAQSQQVSGDLRKLLLTSRRLSIALILGLGFLYFSLTGGSDALAAIGLIAFAGVAQFMPCLLGGLFWRGATEVGALAGMIAGIVLWASTLFLPSFGGDFILSAATVANGPWGIEALRPQALLGLQGLDPLIHALVVSLGANTLLFVGLSALTHPKPLERLQVAQFVDVFRSSAGEGPSFAVGAATAEDLYVLAQRILGAEPARRLFLGMAREQGEQSGLPAPTDAVIGELERVLAGSVGAASAHAMVGRIAEHRTVGMTELIDIADEAQRLIVTTRALSEQSLELEETASQLTQANARLRTLDAQKDEFLSQVSHELRTPMTSIRSFSEILMGEVEIDADDRKRFVGIINDESQRLTRLLDEILDISRLEAGGLDIAVGAVEADQAIAAAVDTVSALAQAGRVQIVVVSANGDRLRQALINLLSNAIKYNTARDPRITIRPGITLAGAVIDVIDNGGGVSAEEAETIFEKFTRGDRARAERGAGLGLPISRAIMRAMNGDLTV
ncbi:MAG: ATP-binding protein, partial [Alphaproteobacteria bacterium]